MTEPTEIDAQRRAALATRDRRADGSFVYAVKTTGVFCRPSCAARAPRPENIRLFDTTAEALAAGFRPCRRCHPLTAANAEPEVSLMAAIADYIARHADEPLGLGPLAAQAGLSPAHFQRRFKAVMGISARDFHEAVRLRRFKRGLRGGGDVLGAALDAGYGSASRAHARADGALGMTPAAYRTGGAGEVISYAVRETALGPLLMAATARGVCCVEFGEDEAALLARLSEEFPRAQLAPAGTETAAALDGWMAALADHLANAAPRPDLPLDLRGTAFQLSVWRFLMRVPPGEVVSYTELAGGVGRPQAVRAAASACAANRIAVLIPCHRALRADGGLGGYRWGLARKRALLDAERAAGKAGSR